VNIITGQSNSGKSSIIRSIWWIKDNKPSGASMVSFWNRGKSGKQVSKTFVSLDTENTSIKREKSDDLNGYSVKLGKEKGKRLEAIGQGQLDEIVKALNFSDINIQYQFDRPFLLDESSSEVARIFNRVIHLDIIDTVQARAELFRRQTNTTINQTEESIKKLEIDLERFNWIEKAEKLQISLDTVVKDIPAKEKYSDSLSEQIYHYKIFEKAAQKKDVLMSALSFIEKIEALYTEIMDTSVKRGKLTESLNEFKEQESIVKKSEIAKQADSFIFSLDKIQDQLNEKEKNFKKISETIENFKSEIYNMKEQNRKEEEYIKLLPKVCPLCGSKL